jgi:Transglycosylase SLT domain
MSRWRHSRLWLAAVCLAGGHGSALATAYECRLAGDGAWRPTRQNLAERFPALVGECRLVDEPPVERPPRPPADARPGEPTDDGLALTVRVITSSGWADGRAPAWQPSGAWWDAIAGSAERHGVDARLVQAVIQVESAYAPTARSPKGAIGLMQLMPATAERYGAPSTESLLDPRVNVEVGVRYLRALLDRFGRTDLALAAYNAGEGAVVRYGYQVPPYRETQDYVRKVRALYDGLDGSQVD